VVLRGGRAEVSGRRHRVRRGGYQDRDTALAALDELRSPVSRPDAPGTISTGGWLRTWLGSHISLAPATVKAYGFHIQLHLEPALGRIPLKELRGGDVQAMFNRLAKGGKNRRPLSPSTLERIRVTLRVAMNAAIREGLIERNPALNLELPRQRKARAVIWTEDQVAWWKRTGKRHSVAVWTPAQTAQFLHGSHEHRLYAAFHLVALRGLRRAETAGLRWCDIDLDNGILVITHTIQRINGLLMHCPPKTRTSRRIVVLDRSTVKELRLHQARQRIEAAQLGLVPSGFAFTNRRGQPLNPDHLYREFMKTAADLGMPPIRLHDLRHVAASLALAAGNELKVIQDQLGHSSIVLTADTYVSVALELARKSAESTARLVLRDSRYVPGTHRVRHHGVLPGDKRVATDLQSVMS
jgi:integrase